MGTAPRMPMGNQKIRIEEIAKSVNRSSTPYWNFTSKIIQGKTSLQWNANSGYIDVSNKTVQTGFLFKFRHDNPTFTLFANGVIYASVDGGKSYKQYSNGQLIWSGSDTTDKTVYAYKEV